MSHDEMDSLIPPKLRKVAADRDHIQTKEMAHAVSCSPKTVLQNLSQKGNFLGITPVKVGRKLLWRVSDIAALLRGGAL